MSDMRETLMGIIARDVMDVGETADAIIAALPDMVCPLQWEEITDRCWDAPSIGGFYRVLHRIDGAGNMRVNGSMYEQTEHPNPDAAKAAAQAHHTAVIISAFGVQGGEA